jgi:NTE family protein
LRGHGNAPILARDRIFAVLDILRRHVRITDDRSTDAGDIARTSAGAPPSVGLALSGGAARGFAHIGVMRTLVANGIRPDVITGTSIGAVVGGVYAAGRLDDFEAWARHLTRRRVFGYLDFSLSGSGLIGGDRLFARLDQTLGDVTFQELPIRLAAVATELRTNHEIWLTRGRLADALRASSALPGIFPAHRIGGRWLMDGALVNPLPISAARALGARLVIGVNLNADNFGRGTIIQDHGSDAEDELRRLALKEKLGLRGRAERLVKRKFFGSSDRPGLSTVMIDAFQVLQDRITRARLAGDPPDVLISPRLTRVNLFDFHRAEELIAIGAEATERALPAIAEAVETLS